MGKKDIAVVLTAYNRPDQYAPRHLANAAAGLLDVREFAVQVPQISGCAELLLDGGHAMFANAPC